MVPCYCIYDYPLFPMLWPLIKVAIKYREKPLDHPFEYAVTIGGSKETSSTILDPIFFNFMHFLVKRLKE